MNLLPEHITAIDTLIEKRKGLFLVKTHEVIDGIVNKANTTMWWKNEWDNLDKTLQNEIVPLDILAFRMPEIFSFMNETQGNPSASEISDFLESLPEQQKKFEYIRSLLIEVIQRLSKIANPNIIKVWWIILSNKTMVELLIINSDPDESINMENLVSMWEKIALDIFHMLLTTKPLWRLWDSNIKHL
jgi:hypothetical protein